MKNDLQSSEFKGLAQNQIAALRLAASNYKEGKIDYKEAELALLTAREVCRVLRLQKDICDSAKKEPAKHLRDFAGI